MKSLKRAVVALALAVGVGSLAMPVWAGHCSLAKSAGDYGFTINGVLIIPDVGPVPIAAVGRAKLEADGTTSGTEARNVGGGFANETFTGTFTINADCTGIVTLNFYEAGELVRTSVLSTVGDDDNREIRMVQQSLTLPDGTTLPVILTVEARRIERADSD